MTVTIAVWIFCVIIVLSFLIGFSLHYILYKKSNAGVIIIEKTDDPNEHDKMVFQLVKDLNELYSMKRIGLKIVLKEHINDNSHNEDIT